MRRATTTTILLTTMLMGATALLSCSAGQGDYVQLYASEPKAPSLTEQGIQNLDHLGPTLIDQGTNFGVYSENATRLELLLFEDPESEEPTRRVPMELSLIHI